MRFELNKKYLESWDVWFSSIGTATWMGWKPDGGPTGLLDRITLFMRGSITTTKIQEYKIVFSILSKGQDCTKKT